MNVIFISHGSAKKNPQLEHSELQVTPLELYTARPLVRFMKRCVSGKVNWAILSLKYGIWFPFQKHTWYDKKPIRVTKEEFDLLVLNFDKSLESFDEIWFYYNPSRFDNLYKRILYTSRLKEKIKLFSSIHIIDNPRY